MGWFSKKKDNDLIETYGVVYKGGHSEYPKEKMGELKLKIFQDHFEFLPTIGSKKWFRGLIVSYDKVLDLQIVQRQVGTIEGILGGLDSRQLNQANNIHISYENENGEVVILRFEMLSGITVMGQAKKCREFEDRLRWHHIREKFRSFNTEAIQKTNREDIPGQIEKYAALRDKGIISQDEFDSKKMNYFQ